MWPFRRKADAPPADGPHPVPAPVIRHDWAELPPIQRFIGAHPLTAPSDEFSDDLATHQDPSVSTDTMGHQVSAEAPPGLVLALARPTTRSDGPAMIPRPRVQRSVAGAVAESGEWDGDEAAPATRPTPLPISAPTVAARELPVVAPEPAIQRLTSLEPDAEPMPVQPVQRSRAVSSSPTQSSPTDDAFEMPAPTQRLTLGQSRRLGLGAPIRQVPDHNVQRAASLPELPPRERELIDASTSMREPMDSSSKNRIADVSSKTRSPMDLSSVVSETRASTFPGAPAPSFDATDEPRLDLPLARRPAADEPSPGDRTMIAPTTPSAQLSPMTSAEPPTDTSMATRPRVHHFADGDSPSWSSIETRQTMSDVLPSLPLVPEAPLRIPMPASSVPPARGAIAPLASARSLKPTAFVQRANAPLTLPQTVREDAELPEREGLMPTLTLPQRVTDDQASALQRASADLSAPRLTPPQRGREMSSGQLELPAPNVRGAQPLPLAPLAALAPSRGFAVQRAAQAVDDSEAEAIESPMESDAPVVQGAWYETRAAVSRVSAGVAPERAVATPTGPHQAETDMDELAGKLYDRIRSRLKTELLVDRERAGFLTDLR